MNDAGTCTQTTLIRRTAVGDVLDYSVRFAAPDDAGVFTGHAAVFN
jgi:hypothetical protein